MDIKAYDPKTQIPDLSGKVFLITGGTAGLGETTIRALSTHQPAHIFFTGRNITAADSLTESLKLKAPGVPITFLQADMSSLASVADLAKSFTSLSSRLDVLVCNAGVMALPPALSKDGYELQFSTNHLGHALLIRLLLPTLQSTAKTPAGDARIVNLTSTAHSMHPKAGIAFDTLKTTQEGLGTIAGASWARYGQSKLANMLYADELARRHSEILTVCIHPGVIDTGLVKNMPLSKRIPMKLSNRGKFVSADEGARNEIWAATAPRETIVSGQYYEPVGKKGERKGKGNDVELAKKLYEWTEKELAGFSAPAAA